jgi:hypothetical protein
VTAPAALAAVPQDSRRWRWPIEPDRYDTTPMVRAAEQQAIVDFGVDNLRRLARHDPAAPGWRQIRRLLRPLDDAGAALKAPPTPHRRRAMLDASAVMLLRCAETGRSYWAWTEAEWANLLGGDQHGFHTATTGWADAAVRLYLAAHAFLLGGFTAFSRLGSFSRLTLAWRIFGRDRVDAEIRRIRLVLAGWGYQLGRDDDTLLPMVACQVFLLNRSPQVEALRTELFDRIRRERLLPDPGLNTLHAMQRAWPTWACATRQPRAPAATRPEPAADRSSGRGGWTAGMPPPRSPPGPAAASARSCSRSGGGCRPSTPRPPIRQPGRGRPAQPGSPRWTG